MSKEDGWNNVHGAQWLLVASIGITYQAAIGGRGMLSLSPAAGQGRMVSVHLPCLPQAFLLLFAFETCGELIFLSRTGRIKSLNELDRAPSMVSLVSHPLIVVLPM